MINRQRQLVLWETRKAFAEEMIIAVRALMKAENIREAGIENAKEEKRALSANWKANPIFYKCAHCQKTSPRGPNKRDAWLLALDQGWFLDATLKKFCPACKPKTGN